MKRASLKVGLLLLVIASLTVAAGLPALVAWAQATWGSDQLIEDNAGFDGWGAQVAMDGSQVVAVWQQYDGSNNTIYSNYSSDGGATWGANQSIEDNTWFGAEDPQVAMDGSRVVAVWHQHDGSATRIYSNYSSDGGATWGSHQLIEDNAGLQAWEPQVAMDGSQVVAVWTQSDGSAYRIYSNYSSDGGATWGADQLIEDNAGLTAGDPQVAMDGSRIVAVWTQLNGTGLGRIHSNYSMDGGATWGADQLIEDSAGFWAEYAQVAIDGSQVVAVWRQQAGGIGRIYSNYSSDGGATWGSHQSIEDNVGFLAYDPQVAMDGSRVVAVWQQQDGTTYRIYSNYSGDGGATWGSDQLIEDNAGLYATWPRVAMDGSRVVAVWDQWDYLTYRIHSNYSSDGGATWGSDQLIEDNFGFWAWKPQLAMDGSRVVAVWHQHDGSTFRIYSNHGCVPPLPVQIDIKPGSQLNPVNPCSKGVIPVAILGNDTFDVATVDPETVVFAGAQPLRWALEDVDDDGYTDMILHFKTRETTIEAGDVEAALEAKLTDETEIVGTDSVRTVGKCGSTSSPSGASNRRNL